MENQTSVNLTSVKQEIQENAVQVEEAHMDYTKDIWEASIKGSIKAIKYYYNQNPENLTKKCKNMRNNSPLHLASLHGHLELVQFLASKGVEIDVVNSFNATPLILASLQGHHHIIKYLIENGAKINHQNNDGNTPLHRAIMKNKIEAVKVLAEKGANILVRNNENITPYFLAEYKNFINYLLPK